MLHSGSDKQSRLAYGVVFMGKTLKLGSRSLYPDVLNGYQ